MSKRFVYFYFMKDNPDGIREIVPSHIHYWKTSKLEKYLGGPFTDRTGGLISFETTSLDKAIEIVEKDPFVSNDLVEMRWIKEWLPE
jgi:uncharacterized protein YciI